MKKTILFLSLILLVVWGCNSNSETDENKNSENEQTVAIDKETATDSYCYITKVFESGNKFYVTVDNIQFLTGEEAEIEAKKNGTEVYNDYIVKNDNEKLRTFLITDKTEILLIDFENGIDAVSKSITDLKNTDVTLYIYTLNVKDGVTTKVEQIYVP